MKLILASTSPYRKELLSRLGTPFDCLSPVVDETPLAHEKIEDLVVRLSILKASNIRDQLLSSPDQETAALIIGSDQSALLNGEVLTKPGNYENAFKQLKAASGQSVSFLTGLCLLNSKTGSMQTACVPYTVVFKKLSDELIERYLKKEQPYNCAGSFKSEGLGVVLFEKFDGNDPSSLIGLPLIKLTEFLSLENYDIFDN